ncbi:MAG: hypothetical protein LH618_08160, partial [Saprospiraceae bacterium]|nr:hypothetical protein [Saprospiraceae bacterium]
SDYTLAVDREYETDQGWTLRGDLALQDEKKSLAYLGAKIDSSFGSGQANAPSIPTFLTDWSVQSLHTDFNTKSKNFDFSIDVKNADLPALDLAFGIHLTHSDTAFTKEFDAIAKYISAKVNVEFDLTITEEDSVGPPASKKTATCRAPKRRMVSCVVCWAWVNLITCCCCSAPTPLVRARLMMMKPKPTQRHRRKQPPNPFCVKAPSCCRSPRAPSNRKPRRFQLGNQPTPI